MKTPPCLLLLGGAIALFSLPLTVFAQGVHMIRLSDAGLWERLEYRLEGAPEVENPFDPDQIRIDAHFLTPSGETRIVPAFWYRAFDRSLDDGVERVVPVGKAEWRLRFTPTEAGVYQVRLKMKVGEGAVRDVAEGAFAVSRREIAGRHGWARIRDDGRYFETTDGRPLRLIGENVCWNGPRGTYDYDDWFHAMAESGQNYARLWMSPWAIGIEHNPGTLNRYDLADAWRLDHLFERAEREGLFLMLCFDHHGMFQTDDRGWGGTNNFWDSDNPYSATLGGPCEHPNDFFTSAEARALYRKKLRYLVARYGYSPFLHSWQFFNEVDNLYRQRGMVGEDIVAWHAEMGAALKAIDPYDHLVTTSLTGGSERDVYWELEDMDFSMYHSYFDPAPGRKMAQLADRFVRDFGKPFMVGEYGTSAYGLNLEEDPYLRGFRQILWSGAMGGSVGSSLTWWWEDVDAENLYPLYAVMHAVLDDEARWQEDDWEPLPLGWTPPPLEVGDPVPGAEPFTAELSLNRFRRIVLDGAVAVPSPLAAARAAESLQSYLRPKGTDEFRPMRLHAWMGADARLVARVTAVSAKAELVVEVDGEEVFREAIADRDGSDRLNEEPEMDETYRVPLPAGPHEVTLSNHGEGWIYLQDLRLENLRPAQFAGGYRFRPETMGLRTKDRAVLYVVSPHVVYPAGAKRFHPPVVSGATVFLGDLEPGVYSVRWFDTVTGESVASERLAASSSLSLVVPDFNEELVAVVERVP